MRAPWILIGLALALAASGCGGAAGAEGEPVGEVRGAPLRSPPKEAGEAEAEELADEDASRKEPEPERDDSPAADYAELVPESEARDHAWVDFEQLKDFDFPGMTSGVELPELPADVRALEGRKVAMEGFMNPLAFDAGGVSEFTLVADPSLCCFGATPQLNHFVHVTLPEGERTDFHSMVPIAVYGTLHVGAELEDGIVLSLYRMEARYVVSLY